MTRPNRYPYTRSQWGEEIADYYTYAADICVTSYILKKINLLKKLRARRLSDRRSYYGYVT